MCVIIFFCFRATLHDKLHCQRFLYVSSCCAGVIFRRSCHGTTNKFNVQHPIRGGGAPLIFITFTVRTNPFGIIGVTVPIGDHIYAETTGPPETLPPGGFIGQRDRSIRWIFYYGNPRRTEGLATSGTRPRWTGPMRARSDDNRRNLSAEPCYKIS